MKTETTNQQWKVRVFCGSSGFNGEADVKLDVVAPGCTVEQVRQITEAAPDLAEALKRMVAYYAGPRAFADKEIDNAARAALRKAGIE